LAQDDKFVTNGFQPLRRGQVMAGAEEEQRQTENTPNLSFTRRKTEQNPQQSIFPNWDLLPPKTIIRRKG